MEEDFFGYFDDEQNKLFRKFEKMNKTGQVTFLDVDEFEELVSVYLDTGNLAKAAQVLEIALRQHPAATTLRLLEADLRVRKKKFAEALRILVSLQRLEPDNPEVLFLLAVVHLNRFHFEEAFRLFSVAMNLDHDGELEMTIRAGKQLSDFYCLPQGRSCFYRALEKYPGDPEIIYELYASWESSGDQKMTRYWIDNYLDEDPFSGEMWYLAALGRWQSGQYETALDAVEYAIALMPEQKSYVFLKATILGRLHRTTEASQWLSGLDPDSINTPTRRLALAMAHVEAGNARTALGYLPEEQQIEKKYLEMMQSWAARIYQGLARMDIATGIYETALERRTRDDALLINAYRFFRRNNRPAKAMEALNMLIDVDPYRVSYRKHMLRLAEEILPEKERHAAYRQVIKDMPGVADFHYHYGFFLLNDGETKKGFRYIRNGLILEPGKCKRYLKANPEWQDHHELQIIIDHYKNKTYEL